jgi:hypothetical protein
MTNADMAIDKPAAQTLVNDPDYIKATVPCLARIQGVCGR